MVSSVLYFWISLIFKRFIGLAGLMVQLRWKKLLEADRKILRSYCLTTTSWYRVRTNKPKQSRTLISRVSRMDRSLTYNSPQQNFDVLFVGEVLGRFCFWTSLVDVRGGVWDMFGTCLMDIWTFKGLQIVSGKVLRGFKTCDTSMSNYTNLLTLSTKNTHISKGSCIDKPNNFKLHRSHKHLHHVHKVLHKTYMSLTITA